MNVDRGLRTEGMLTFSDQGKRETSQGDYKAGASEV